MVLRTTASWGSTPCHLNGDDNDGDGEDDDDGDEYTADIGEEEQEESAASTSDDDIHIYPSSRNQCSYSGRNNQGR